MLLFHIAASSELHFQENYDLIAFASRATPLGEAIPIRIVHSDQAGYRRMR